MAVNLLGIWHKLDLAEQDAVRYAYHHHLKFPDGPLPKEFLLWDAEKVCEWLKDRRSYFNFNNSDFSESYRALRKLEAHIRQMSKHDPIPV